MAQRSDLTAQTFLFADLSGFTALTEAHGDEQAADLLWEDGFCSDDCREQVTGCPVPLCGCGGACGCALGTTARQPDRNGSA